MHFFAKKRLKNLKFLNKVLTYTCSNLLIHFRLFEKHLQEAHYGRTQTNCR